MPRRPAAPKHEDPVTPWGTLDWSHAPVNRVGYFGPCTRCGMPASMRHPTTGVPCHKVCEDKHPRTAPLD